MLRAAMTCSQHLGSVPETHREDEGLADELGGELHGALLADVADEDLAGLALRAAGDGHVRAVQVLRQPYDLRAQRGTAVCMPPPSEHSSEMYYCWAYSGP